MTIRFGYFYLNGKLVIYDVCEEERQGRRYYIASLSEDPKVNFSSVSQANAIEQLMTHLERLYHPKAPLRLSWLQPDVRTPAAG